MNQFGERKYNLVTPSHYINHFSTWSAVAVWLCAFGLLASLGEVCQAASPADATSSKDARAEAIRQIPWRSLSNQQRRALQKVLKRSALYRRLPTQVIDCDPEMFTFLMQRPEVVAETWRKMGVSKLLIDRTGEQTFNAKDGLGTTGRFTYLQSTWTEKAQNRAVIYAEGAFEGKPFAQPIHARCVMLLQSGSVEEANGRTYVTARLDTFLDIERKGVELVAKAAQPLMYKAAEHNFKETLRFVSSFSRAAERNPAGVERFCADLTTLDDDARRDLMDLSQRAADRYAQARHVPVERKPVLAQRVSLPGKPLTE